MDYGKLTKEELIKLCEERKLSFSSSWKKEKIEEFLIKNDENNKKFKDNKIGKIGSIINIVFSSISLVLCVLYLIIFISTLMSVSAVLLHFPWVLFWFFVTLLIVLAIGSVFTIVSNYRYYKGKNNKKTAGILGLIFSGIIGGILVFFGD